MASTNRPDRAGLHRLAPEYRERVWGGQRLRPSAPPIGEAWIGWERSRIAGGPLDGLTIAAAAADDPSWIMGEPVAARHDTRFPLLVKLLDCADWLSVQVHPDDEQARRMVGPDELGKTEAWLFLAASDDACIIAGVEPGTTRDALASAVRDGTILDVAARLSVRAGDGIVVPAGMLHALGPGLLVYEVQESSDTTYRVYDWGRPASASRALHIEECCDVLRPHPRPSPVHVDLERAIERPAQSEVLETEYFDVDLFAAPPGEALEASTGRRSFHLLTCVEGRATVRCGAEAMALETYETALVAGGAGDYTIAVDGAPARVLRAAVPV